MFFKYGSYQHDASEAEVRVSTRRLFSRRGHPMRLRKTLRVTGSLLATTEATMTAAVAALEAGYEKDGRSCGLYQTNGTLVADHALTNADAIGGVRVIGIEYPQGGGVFATNRPFAVTLEADYFPPKVNNLLEYGQSIRRIGTGGPRRVLVPLVDGLPDIQYPQLRTVTHAIQSGRAVGLTAYPTRPAPLWPGWEEADRREYGSLEPENENGTRTGYGVSWTYYFSGIGPF